MYDNSYIEYEINSDKNKTLLIKEYLDVIKPDLKGHKWSHREKWSIKNTIIVEINFMFSKDNDNEVLTYSESTNMGASVNNKEYEVIKELFQSFLSSYQIG